MCNRFLLSMLLISPLFMNASSDSVTVLHAASKAHEPLLTSINNADLTSFKVAQSIIPTLDYFSLQECISKTKKQIHALNILTKVYNANRLQGTKNVLLKMSESAQQSVNHELEENRKREKAGVTYGSKGLLYYKQQYLTRASTDQNTSKEEKQAAHILQTNDLWLWACEDELLTCLHGAEHCGSGQAEYLIQAPINIKAMQTQLEAEFKKFVITQYYDSKRKKYYETISKKEDKTGWCVTS